MWEHDLVREGLALIASTLARAPLGS